LNKQKINQKEKLMSNPIKDSIFKELFEDRAIFYDFLKAFLPREITQQIKEKQI